MTVFVAVLVIVVVVIGGAVDREMTSLGARIVAEMIALTAVAVAAAHRQQTLAIARVIPRGRQLLVAPRRVALQLPPHLVHLHRRTTA